MLRLGLRGLVVAALVVGLVLGSSPRPALAAGLLVQDLTSAVTATNLAQMLAGPGVTISNVTYVGAQVAAGQFSGGTGIIGFEDGVILSSGCAKNVIGPNASNNITCNNGTAGDAQLTALAGFPTFDAAVLEFDLVPNQSTLAFDYVFASDEYNEFANTAFNDVFAFSVNGTNCALVPGTSQPVSINTINGGNPFGTNAKHPELFRNNALPGATINTEMDGLTVVLSCAASVTANATNHIKLAVADGSDAVLDSNVFLKAHSFTTETTPPSCALTGVIAGPPKQLQITVQDTGSGLNSVVASTLVNATASIPAFSTGTTSALVVTATKIDQSIGAQVGLTVTDVAGNQTVCDPVLTTLVRGNGQSSSETFKQLAAAESKITLLNGTPGMDKVTIVVNGKRFRVDDLNDGTTKTIDVASAMHAGNTNTIVVTAHGDRGTSLTIVIHD